MTVSGVDNTDFSIDKTTAIHEQIALKFTVEFFNLFNRTQFSPPNTKPVTPRSVPLLLSKIILVSFKGLCA